jgi:hypothetical protein
MKINIPCSDSMRKFLKEAKASGVNPNIEMRWENGVEHHPKSIALMEKISDCDYLFNDNTMDWKCGGDGDNGEELMYLLDIIFEMEEAE